MEVLFSAVRQPAYDGTHFGDYIYSFLYSADREPFKKEVGMNG